MVWTIVEKKGTWVNINTSINFFIDKEIFFKIIGTVCPFYLYNNVTVFVFIDKEERDICLKFQL